MYIPDGTETIVRFRNNRHREGLPVGEHRIAMDLEVLAYFMNDSDVEVLEEESLFSRLNPADYPHLQSRVTGEAQ